MTKTLLSHFMQERSMLPAQSAASSICNICLVLKDEKRYIRFHPSLLTFFFAEWTFVVWTLYFIISSIFHFSHKALKAVPCLQYDFGGQCCILVLTLDRHSCFGSLVFLVKVQGYHSGVLFCNCNRPCP